MVVSTQQVMTLERLLIQIGHELQLPPYLDQEVRAHYEALASFLSGGVLAPFSPALYAQGSFRLGTTVKPVGQDHFDLDFICQLLLPATVSSQLVYELVASAIESNGRYKGKTERMPRCIRVNFANHCHVDIVPAVPMGDGSEAIYIPDHVGDSWSWRSTNPKGYVRWFNSLGQPAIAEKMRASIEPLPAPQPIAAKSPLQVGVQLLKRNHQNVISDVHLRTPSIVLTTIAGNEVAGIGDSVGMISGLVHVLKAKYAATATPQHIRHPAHNEVISEKWNDARIYRKFRDYAETFHDQWQTVLVAQTRGFEAIAAALFVMFGEWPVQAALKSLGERTRELTNDSRIRTAALGGLVITDVGRGNPRKTFYGDD